MPRCPPTLAKRRPERESGVALLIVLWVMALLAVLALSFVNDARTDLQMVRNQYEAARARSIADAGVSLAVLGLVQPTAATTWREDGTATPLAFDGGSLEISLQDEAGKIDINSASPALLADLFRVVGLDQDTAGQLAGAIAEWRARQLLTSRKRPGSAGPPVVADPAADAFKSVEDLGLVPGMTPALFRRIAPFITIYSRTAAIDPLTAPIEVLDSLPELNPNRIQALVTARATAVAIAGTLPMLNDPHGTEPRATSRTFTIRSKGVTAAGTTFIREAVVALAGDSKTGFRFLAWRQAMEPVRSTGQ